jgi:anti-sigma B factor antagonist
MELEQRIDGDVVVLVVSGELTFKGGSWGTPLTDSVRRALEAGHVHFAVDLGGVKYVDSMGIGQLVQALAAVRKRGGVMRLTNLTRRVTEILALTNLQTVFDQ